MSEMLLRYSRQFLSRFRKQAETVEDTSQLQVALTIDVGDLPDFDNLQIDEDP